MESYRIGVDIGGTFTDIVFLGNKGNLLIKKVASTPEDYSKSVIKGISEGINELNINSSNISEINHGFTVATNAILEGKGEKTALITTKGFRDILEIADGVVIGSSLKVDGDTWKAVDENRAREFMDEVKKIRKK